MSIIHPFRALRPKKELASKVASLPYDVMNSEEAREMAAGNPYSFLHVVKPEINLEPGVNLYDDVVYQAGADALRRMVTEGTLHKEVDPALYVYQQAWNGHVQTGLVCGTHADEYDADRIKKHEFTREVKEKDRIRHVRTLNCNTGPVFLAYRATPSVDDLLMAVTRETPEYDFVSDDGIGHTLWVVAEPERISAIVEAFKPLEALYVADGHHRSASGAKVAGLRREANPCHTGEEEYNYFLSVIFPHNQLKIMDYNRVIKDLAGMTPDAFKAALEQNFTVAPASDPRPSAPRTFGMYLEGTWYTLTAKPGTFPAQDPVLSLDASILQNNLFAPLLGIGDPRKDERIDFVGGIRGLKELEKRVNNDWAVAFAMFPTSMDELMRIADAGKTMPPKSTWFEPKLRSGLVIHPLD